jgi:hypothetical protein
LFICIYKSGRTERLITDETVPPPSTALPPAWPHRMSPSTPPATFIRLYLPPMLAGTDAGVKLPVIVYFHGGGFMVESAASVRYHRYHNALAARGGAVLVSVDYCRVSEYQLPAAYDDSWAALRWAVAACCCGGGSAPIVTTPEPWVAEHEDPTRVFLAGIAQAPTSHTMSPCAPPPPPTRGSRRSEACCWQKPTIRATKNQ